MAPIKKEKGSAVVKKEQASAATFAAKRAQELALTIKWRNATTSANLAIHAAAHAKVAAEAADAAAKAAIVALRKHRIGDFAGRLNTADLNFLQPLINNSQSSMFGCTSMAIKVNALNEYKKFILLKAVDNDLFGTKLLPSPMIDEIWKLHIHETLAYLSMNKALFPREEGDAEQKMIHHTSSDHSDFASHSLYKTRTRSSYRNYFGDFDSMAETIWSYEKGYF
jgi:hypothetical protein